VTQSGVRLARHFRLDPRVRPVRFALHFDLDLDAWTFRGTEHLEFTTRTPLRELVLHARELEITKVPASCELSLERDAEALVLRFASELAPGPHTVDLEFAGSIRPDLKSLYRSIQGQERYAITTLWPAEARRLYPCFDEPPFKARFALELTAPSDMVAIANMRVVDRTAAGEGRTHWRFAETPPLSPYLLAFAVGPFDGTPEIATKTGVPVRIWVPRGLVADATFARDASRGAIDWLEPYTGIPYPYDKVEGVGVRDFPAGAMENPGAVTYRVELVTAQPGKASARALKSTVSVVAHELTHMWWGDLATLAWWDDLWLSESFATFIGTKAEDAMHPEWGTWRDFVAGSTRGFALDALASTHAIHADAGSAEAALQRVDAITYQKGAAVLRMIEAYLGADVFRTGVRLYLRRFSESSATADDFWRALDEASRQDVTRVARTWVDSPGHPIVDLGPAGPGQVSLRQRRFFTDPRAPGSDQRWPIPMVVRSAEGVSRLLFDGAETTMPSRKGWLFPNADAAGFYRFKLAPELRARLLASAGQLETVERLLLADNDWALMRAGVIDAAAYLATLDALAGEGDRAVLGVIAEQLQWLGVHAVSEATRGDFAKIVARAFEPAFARLGWDAKRDETADDQELRPLAIRVLGDLAEDHEVRAEAARRVYRHLDGDRQEPNLIEACATVAARDGDLALQKRYLARLREAMQSDPQDEQNFRAGLASFDDPAATDATLACVDQGVIRDQDLPDIYQTGVRNVAARERYWHHLRQSYPSRIAPLEAMVRNAVLAAAAQLTPGALADDADAFLASIGEGDSAEFVTRTRESLRLASDAAKRIGRELEIALPR
jgi:puromycin-sensitive aminopeptidase